MSVNSKLYEGKAKILYATEDPEILLADFKDDATAFNAQKRGSIENKGMINCRISSQLFQKLAKQGIKTHFIDSPGPNLMRVKAVKIIPVEVVVRNIAAGSLCKQTGLIPGTVLSKPLVEFYYKNDYLGDPLLTRDRLLLLELATPEQVDQIIYLALEINKFLREFWEKCQITLVDFKLEFGLDHQQQILLADEISPDTCRLWDMIETDPENRIMDKDRFRRDLGNIEDAYQQVLRRVLEVV
ncbi:phosphoribosylaminoimidazolesuccinocarboxamide synthase [Dolichospermum circinale CS-1225]|uniref:Phosphoribosylaminoimidazole-succinocarboxamide synthase n=1 Tax=Dolichospermum circinale CS-537/01 TaxID=3021739 RepID=A0ABT5A895_9CYAN|nr:phosphoribosylaminoimidazolesuccinocarboxamide synthase [Dolichospermum circinale]MDB9458247.1 phosphoribosylaminoimidazolesuccinocarboxamide synthase [Dolichospermum circinale CS-545/17]MDB9455407.1 phosphoribosylaminoimidazolesuccinocarboxamide synthase [Dolichospermum circinale CS-541/06]MDB9464078.1 phosphoribosylaminoimidazolesuccinocarboxamide synthase [Dolichospermum circinale CS-541/04]MDB9468655.1 phosphoribosylaminoimidazolesuccinocarboxamide synthase [Dolichospermum circinale CS-5